MIIEFILCEWILAVYPCESVIIKMATKVEIELLSNWCHIIQVKILLHFDAHL